MTTPKMLQVQQIDFVTLLNEIDGIIETRLKSFTPPPPTPNDEEKIMTQDEVCDFLGITKPTCVEHGKKGLLIPYRLGRGVRYKRSEVLLALKAIHAKKKS